MSLAAVRRARGLPLTLLRQALASCLHQCLPSGAGGGSGSGGGSCGGTSAVAAPGAASLWRYDSPLLRHLSSAPVKDQVRATSLLLLVCSSRPPSVLASCRLLASPRTLAWAAGGAFEP